MQEIKMPSLSAIKRELARRSFEYWAPYVFSIVNKDGEHTNLELNYTQRTLEHEESTMLRETGTARLYVLKGRQSGITTYEQAKSLECSIKNPGAKVLTLAHDKETTERIFEITNYAIESAPGGEIPEMGQGRAKEIKFIDINSRFFTGTAGARGGRVGRGLTLRRLHASEFAFWDKPKRTLNAITPAMVPRGSVVVLETTASGFDTEAHKFWRDAKAGHNSYKPIFFPWWVCDKRNYQKPLLSPDELGKLDEDEDLLIKEMGLTLEEIKWRRHMIKEMGGKDDFLQEYPEDDESCWLAVGGMYYPASELRKLQMMAPKPIRTEMSGELEIFADWDGVERVIMGVDTAEGVNKDSSTMVARTFPSWRLLRKYASPKIQPREFAEMLNTQGRELGTAYMVVEKNMHGITVLRDLRDIHYYPVGQIYHREPLDKALPNVSERIGWHTSGESKPLMLAAGRDLFKAALQGYAHPPSSDAVSDALGVRRGEDGKFDLNGRDVLVAEMLCWLGRTAPSSTGMLDWITEQETEKRKNTDPRI